MPTRRAAVPDDASFGVQVRDADLPAGVDVDETGDEDDGTAIAERIRESVAAGERVYVRVFKKMETGEWAACRDFTPDEVLQGDLSVIRDEFGPGFFELRITGRRGFLGRPKVTIAPSLKPAPAAEVSQRSETGQLLSAILEGQQALMQKLANPAPPPPPPPSLLQQLGVTSLSDALALAGSLKGLFGSGTPSAPAAQPVKSAAEQLREVLELKKMLREDEPGDPDKEESLLSLAPKFLDVLKAGMQQQPDNALPVVAMPDSIATAHETVPQQPKAPNVEDDIKPVIDEAFAMLQRKEDAAKIGDYLYEYLPDEAFQLFKLPNWFAMLCSYAPQFSPYQAELIQAHARIGQRMERAKG